MRIIIILIWVISIFSMPMYLHAEQGNNANLAVSIKVLQKKMEECSNGHNCEEDIDHLCGMTRLDGYVLDEQNKDLILFGTNDGDAPKLNTEDFIVALRNVWRVYAEKSEEGIYYYSYPGCSIDPDVADIEILREIANEVATQFEEDSINKLLDFWVEVCSKSQSVKVWGVPRNSHFAETMVTADYELKLMMNESFSQYGRGLKNLSQLYIQQAEDDFKAGKPISLMPCINRFWFYPGKSLFLYQPGIIFTRMFYIKLLTENYYEKLMKQSGLAIDVTEDSIADNFADMFNNNQEAIFTNKPIFFELEGLFRFMYLAELIKMNNTDLVFDLDYLLYTATLTEYEVPETLDGISYTQKVEKHQLISNGRETMQIWLTSCGGIDISVELIDDINYKRGGQETNLTAFAENILEAKPTPDALCWFFSEE